MPEASPFAHLATDPVDTGGPISGNPLELFEDPEQPEEPEPEPEPEPIQGSPEFKAKLQALRVKAGGLAGAIDQGKKTIKQAGSLRQARLADLLQACKSLHAAVDEMQTRLAAELEAAEQKLTEQSKERLVQAAKPQAMIRAVEAQLARLDDKPDEQEQLLPRIQELLEQTGELPAPGVGRLAGCMDTLENGHLPVSKLEFELAAVCWDTEPVAEQGPTSQRRCVYCNQLFTDPSEECVSHPGQYMRGSASMPGWSCCMQQWPQAEGCRRGLHKPDPEFDEYIKQMAEQQRQQEDKGFLHHLSGALTALLGSENAPPPADTPVDTVAAAE